MKKKLILCLGVFLSLGAMDDELRPASPRSSHSANSLNSNQSRSDSPSVLPDKYLSREEYLRLQACAADDFGPADEPTAPSCGPTSSSVLGARLATVASLGSSQTKRSETAREKALKNIDNIDIDVEAIKAKRAEARNVVIQRWIPNALPHFDYANLKDTSGLECLARNFFDSLELNVFLDSNDDIKNHIFDQMKDELLECLFLKESSQGDLEKVQALLGSRLENTLKNIDKFISNFVDKYFLKSGENFTLGAARLYTILVIECLNQVKEDSWNSVISSIVINAYKADTRVGHTIKFDDFVKGFKRAVVFFAPIFKGEQKKLDDLNDILSAIKEPILTSPIKEGLNNLNNAEKLEYIGHLTREDFSQKISSGLFDHLDMLGLALKADRLDLFNIVLSKFPIAQSVSGRQGCFIHVLEFSSGLDAFKLLVDNGWVCHQKIQASEINGPTQKPVEFTDVLYAAYHKRFDIVLELLNKAKGIMDPNDFKEYINYKINGEYLLKFACESRNFDLLTFLVDNNVDYDNVKLTLYMLLIGWTEGVQLMLDKIRDSQDFNRKYGYNFNTVNNEEFTILSAAIRKKDFELAKSLIGDYHADLKSVLVLKEAVACGDVGFIQFLESQGANVSNLQFTEIQEICSIIINTHLRNALDSKNNELAKHLLSILIKVIESSSINSVSIANLIFYMLSRGWTEGVQLMLGKIKDRQDISNIINFNFKYGHNLNTVDAETVTILSIAIRKKEFELAKSLIDDYRANFTDVLVLKEAIACGDVGFIQFLENKGANVSNLQPSEIKKIHCSIMKTHLRNAIERKDNELVKHLLSILPQFNESDLINSEHILNEALVNKLSPDVIKLLVEKRPYIHIKETLTNLIEYIQLHNLDFRQIFRTISIKRDGFREAALLKYIFQNMQHDKAFELIDVLLGRGIVDLRPSEDEAKCLAKAEQWHLIIKLIRTAVSSLKSDNLRSKANTAILFFKHIANSQKCIEIAEQAKLDLRLLAIELVKQGQIDLARELTKSKNVVFSSSDLCEAIVPGEPGVLPSRELFDFILEFIRVDQMTSILGAKSQLPLNYICDCSGTFELKRYFIDSILNYTQTHCPALDFVNMPSGRSISGRNRCMQTPLIRAVIAEDEEVIAHLLENGANPTIKDSSDKDALWHFNNLKKYHKLDVPKRQRILALLQKYEERFLSSTSN